MMTGSAQAVRSGRETVEADAIEEAPSTIGGARHRILLLGHSSFSDVDYGGGQRSEHISEALQSVGHVSTVAIQRGAQCSRVSQPDPETDLLLTYRSLGPSLQATLDRAKIRGWLAELVAEQDISLIVARYASVASFVPSKLRRRMILDADDVVKATAPSDRAAQRARRRLVSALRSAAVQRLVGQAAHVWFVSPADLRALGGRARSASLLPNAALRYQRPPASRRDEVLLMVGQYAHPPNAEAVDYFLADVLPELRAVRPGVEFRIVGNVPAQARQRWQVHAGVTVTGFVPDISVEYARASAAVAPVQSGGGTQIKVIEALMNGCPMVASEFAFSGFSDRLETGRHLLVARTQADWVSQCLAVLDSPQSAQRMAEEAGFVVDANYGVSALAGLVRQTASAVLNNAHQ